MVTRSKHGTSSNPILSGYTEAERIAHKQWILDNVAKPDYDGETTFTDVEFDVKIKVGDVIKLKSGNYWHVQRVDNRGGAFGYVYKKATLPEIIPENIKITHGNVAGV